MIKLPTFSGRPRCVNARKMPERVNKTGCVEVEGSGQRRGLRLILEGPVRAVPRVPPTARYFWC